MVELSHLLTGLFLGAFGLTYLALTVWRLVRLILANHHEEESAARDDDSATTTTTTTATTTNAAELLLREFLRLHVPEQNSSLLRATSLCITASCAFGIVYAMLGARFLDHDAHPDYTMFHYVTHLTLMLLYLFVGWTGLLEANGYLPTDSLRAATALALWGEALLWYEHGTSKTDDLDAALHYALGGIAALTALSMTASVAVVAGGGSLRRPNIPPPATISFLLYLGALVGLVWQALWFLTVSFYIQGWLPILSTGHATALLVVEGLFLLVLGQLVVVALVRLWHRRRTPPSAIATLFFAGGNNGRRPKHHHETYRLVARIEEETERTTNEDED